MKLSITSKRAVSYHKVWAFLSKTFLTRKLWLRHFCYTTLKHSSKIITALIFFFFFCNTKQKTFCMKKSEYWPLKRSNLLIALLPKICRTDTQSSNTITHLQILESFRIICSVIEYLITCDLNYFSVSCK